MHRFLGFLIAAVPIVIIGVAAVCIKTGNEKLLVKSFASDLMLITWIVLNITAGLYLIIKG